VYYVKWAQFFLIYTRISIVNNLIFDYHVAIFVKARPTTIPISHSFIKSYNSHKIPILVDIIISKFVL